MLQLFLPALWCLFLPYPCSQFLPSATEDLLLPPSPCLVIPDYFHPGSCLDQGPWFPPSRHGSPCWPALACRGLAPEHGPPHVMVQVSATDQMPSPPGSLRQRVACLISGPTAPFILVFSPGYNHELNSPGKQYLQYPLHPNYREQQAEIPACISVRAETPYHVY